MNKTRKRAIEKRRAKGLKFEARRKAGATSESIASGATAQQRSRPPTASQPPRQPRPAPAPVPTAEAAEE